MGIHLADQTVSFLQACLLGAALGALYDIFRILRIAFPPGKVALFLQDLFFFALCAILSFLFLLTASDGIVRMFLLVGELIGALLYHCTLGQMVIRAAGALIAGVKAILRFLNRFLVQPVWRLLYFLVAALLWPARALGGAIKNNLLRARFRLKYRRIVLYNHFTGRIKKHRTSRENRDNGTDQEHGPQET